MTSPKTAQTDVNIDKTGGSGGWSGFEIEKNRVNTSTNGRHRFSKLSPSVTHDRPSNRQTH
jgi:hypothetical protein